MFNLSLLLIKSGFGLVTEVIPLVSHYIDSEEKVNGLCMGDCTIIDGAKYCPFGVIWRIGLNFHLDISCTIKKE